MDTFLAHHGIKGQKWGVRRFQNEDGSWTDEGSRRRERLERKRSKLMSRASRKIDKFKSRSKYTKEEIKDLKKNGIRSDTFDRHYSLVTDGQRLEYAKNNQSQRFKDVVGLSFQDANYKTNGYLTDRGRSYVDTFAKSEYMKDLTKNLNSKYDRQIKDAKKWTDRYNNLKAIDFNSGETDYRGYKAKMRYS